MRAPTQTPAAAPGAGGLLPGDTAAVDVSSLVNCTAGAPVPAVTFSRRNGPPRRYDWDAILDRWAAGLSAPQITAETGYPSKAVDSVLNEARKANDPRAARRLRFVHRDGVLADWRKLAVAEALAGDADDVIAARYGKTRISVRRALNRDGQMPKRLSAAEAAIANGRAVTRAEFLVSLDDLLDEHRSFLAISKATGYSKDWIAMVARSVGRQSKRRVPKPRQVKVKAAPKPVQSFKKLPIAALIRQASMPRIERPAPVYLAECDDSRILKARDILSQDFDADPQSVVRQTGLALRQVYQVRGEMRMARQGAQA